MDRVVEKVKLIKLYSDNNLFDEVNFHSGLNIILGESSEKDVSNGKKTNAVGKSIAIEFLNFALLADYKGSRIEKIPSEIFPLEENVNLIFSIGDRIFLIKRNRKNHSKPTIIENEFYSNFDTIDDARKYLSSILFENLKSISFPSFRSLFSLLCRQEDSEFKDIKKPYDLVKNIPIDLTPHFFIMGYNLSKYSELIANIALVKSQTTIVNKIKTEIEMKFNSISEIKAEINNLKSEVLKLDSALEKYKINETYKSIEADILKLETKMGQLRSQRVILINEFNKLNEGPKIISIDELDIKNIYNSLKQDLGDKIVKTINDVSNFALEIEKFQKIILKDKLLELKNKIKLIDNNLEKLEVVYSELLSILGQKGILKDIKISFKTLDNKRTELSAKSTIYEKYEENNNTLIKYKTDKAQSILYMLENLNENKDNISSLQDSISDIHEAISGNRECSLSIILNEKSKANCPIDIDLRIFDDGSHSINRLKVFLFDISLMINHISSNRHPMILIHDNIFDVDKDSLIKCLNYLYFNIKDDMQYILTLNYDRIEDDESLKALSFDINQFKILKLTKTNKFLKKTYKEI